MASQQNNKRKPFREVMAGLAPDRSGHLQKEWASPIGRFLQGYAVDPLLGTFQSSVHMRDPDMIPLYGFDEDAMRAAATKTVDNYVNKVDRDYNAARVATSQDVGGIDWLRFGGSLLSPSLGSKIKAGSLAGKAAVQGARSLSSRC